MDARFPPRRNRLLLALPACVVSRLSVEFETVALRRHTVLIEGGAQTAYVYFVDYGLISLVKSMQDGRSAEVGVIGPEGMLGVSALLGMTEPSIDAVVQIDGEARRIATAAVLGEFSNSRPFKDSVLGYARYRMSQVAQIAACNRLHRLRQRCCYWLLTAQDSVQTPTFTLTHEFLALMMGVTRPRLSTTLRGLQDEGSISYRYASVTIANRTALEDGACECYASLRREARQISGGLGG